MKSRKQTRYEERSYIPDFCCEILGMVYTPQPEQDGWVVTVRVWQFLVGFFELFTYVVLILGAAAAYGDQDFTPSLSRLFQARCSVVFTAAQNVSQGSKYLYSYHRDTTVLRVCSIYPPETWAREADLGRKDYDCLGDPMRCATECSSISDRDMIISEVTVRGSSLTTAQVLDLPPNLNGSTGWGWSFDVNTNPDAEYCFLNDTSTYFREFASSVEDWTPCPHPFVFEARSTRKTVLGLLAATLSEAITSGILIAAGMCPCFMKLARQCDRQYRVDMLEHRRALLCETPFALLYSCKPLAHTSVLLGPFAIVSVLNDVLVFVCLLVVCGGCYLSAVPLLTAILFFKAIKGLVDVIRCWCYLGRAGDNNDNNNDNNNNNNNKSNDPETGNNNNNNNNNNDDCKSCCGGFFEFCCRGCVFLFTAPFKLLP